jgi:D-alanyl-lipoteichoic acid acyltransferase DltB (MBOAT superfamily)
LLVVAALIFNFLWGRLLSRQPTTWLLACGIGVNLLVLCYFKYTNFLLENANAVLGTQFKMVSIILPLGLSFHTFQQIAYLYDARHGRCGRPAFSDYTLFVLFFPQLIAGPIVYHKDIIPQFQDEGRFRLSAAKLAGGFGYFTIGLAKKVFLADNLALCATPVFSAAEINAPIPGVEAWVGGLAYTLQLYFDFSAYSDMAISLGMMFGLQLPLNFNSPYKATSLIDFWRRWHISLSTFIRDYLYIPMGGNRISAARQATNLVLIMTLVGLWHGAGWNFVLWGLYHGVLLGVNHQWRGAGRAVPVWAAWPLTFLVVMLGFVVFRAKDLTVLGNLFQSMAGMSVGDAAGSIQLSHIQAFKPGAVAAILAASLLMAVATPNVQEIFSQGNRYSWRMNAGWAVGLGLLFCAALLYLSRVSEFLYFQF